MIKITRIQLSKRLQTVADLLVQHSKEPRILADIGSDHAYLPIALIQAGLIDRALAGEVVKGPYQAAQKEVKQRQLEDQIEVRLGDGLEIIQADDGVNIISVCGMGGALIRDILDHGLCQLDTPHLLALQPNLAAPALRSWLNEHMYAIIDEAVVDEKGHLYEIIIAKSHSQQTLGQADLLLGPINRQQNNPQIRKKWLNDKKTYEHIIHGIKQAKYPDYVKIKLLEEDIKLIEKEMLN